MSSYHSRKPRRKKGGHNKPTYVKCAKMVMSDASKALAMAKYLKGLVNVERKNHDSVGTNVARSSTIAIVNLTSIAQGDTTVTRDGSSCKIVSIDFRYFITQNASAANTLVRVMLVLDKQTNQALYATTDLLADVSTSDSIVSLRNLDNQVRFSVLYDKVHAFSITGRGSSSHKFYKTCQYKIRFDNAAAAITSNPGLSLSLLVVSNEATNTPLMTHFLRLRFVDN